MATLKKPKVTIAKTNPRLVGRGTVVIVKGTQQQEAVRAVSIVLHLANGQDVNYTVDEEIEVVENPDPGIVDAMRAIENGVVIDAPDPPVAVTDPPGPAFPDA